MLILCISAKYSSSQRKQLRTAVILMLTCTPTFSHNKTEKDELCQISKSDSKHKTSINKIRKQFNSHYHSIIYSCRSALLGTPVLHLLARFVDITVLLSTNCTPFSNILTLDRKKIMKKHT